VFVILLSVLGTEVYADIFYAASNYNAGSVGVIQGNSRGGYTINAKLVSNFNGDTAGFSFHDHNNELRALVRERASGVGDAVGIYAPSTFSSPILNRSGFGSNIHAITSNGDDLYLVTYESYPVGPEDTGEVIRVDMRNNYTVKNRYHNPKIFYPGFADYAWPHGEGVMVYRDKVYVMFGMSDPSKILDYAPSEVVEFDRALTPTGRKAVLEDSGVQIGKNALTMALYGDKLYIGCIGGRQGTGVYGDVWEIDMNNFGAPPRQVLDFEQVTGVLAGAGWGAYGVDFTDDGTAFILAGGYDSGMDFKGRLFKIPASDLTAGGQRAIDGLVVAHNFTNAGGHSWWDGVTWDAKSDTVWCMSGTHLIAFDKNGNVIRDFTPLELGEDIYSVALFNEAPPDAPGGEETDPPVSESTIDDPNVESVALENLEIVSVPSDSTVRDVLDSLPGLPTDIGALNPKFDVNSSGQLMANSGTVWQGLTVAESAVIRQSSLTPIPVFRATVSSDKTALVSVKMNFSGTKLAGNDFDDLRLLKLKRDGRTTEKLRKVNAWADITHGTFILTDTSGDPQHGVIGSREYLLNVAIKDNSDYDWSADAETVIDPLVAAIEGEEENPDGTSPDGTDLGGGTSSGGMPGGCIVTSSRAVALTLAVLLYKRKNR
jgi:hypothetical protein